ncbi:hypothetical protein [Sinimarinibacterium flocculans]|uniref:hypothetical protein n=1 Tax=Sinimarinibacterium flocculans TaxID=985250 RepID=UPI0035147A2A
MPALRTCRILALAAGAAASAIAWPATGATEIAADTRYEGPQTLGVAALGVEMTIPAGWIAQLPSGSEVMVVGSTRHQGFVVIGADELDDAGVREALRGPLPLGGGVTLLPVGEPERRDGTYAARFTVQGGQAGMQASGRAIVGRHGYSAYLLAVYPEAEAGDLGQLLDSLTASVRLQAPAAGAATRAEGAGTLSPAVAGQKITRFYSGSGYSESETIHLCSNGTYYRGFEAGGFTPGVASGAVASRNAGTWSTPPGQLVLRAPNGSTSTYSMRVEGSKLLLDGTRWFREPTACE